MRILCPHCQGAIELVEAEPVAEVTCPSCGSTINVSEEAGNVGTPTMTATHDPSRPFGRFVLLAPLGTGAFGTVYKAHDPQLDRVVALKVPRPGNLGGPADRERFLREARAAAKLRHPAIVAIHEVGEIEGQTYIASELIDGVNLAEWLTAKRPTFRDAATLVAEVPGRGSPSST